MTELLFESSSLESAIQALHSDLLDEGSPKISTMRNYRFAILQYDPRDEFKLRARIRWLTDDLKSQGWNVLAISLQHLLLTRIKKEDRRVLDKLFHI